MRQTQEEQSPQKKSSLLSTLAKGQSKQKQTATTSGNAQVTRAGANSEPGKGKHSKKWDDCVQDVKKKGSADNAYAVCTTSVNESKKRRAGEFNFLGSFKEALDQAGAQPQGKKFRVTLLQEGLGNFKDCYFYTKDAIASAVPLYEGAHFFVDHPSQSEEQDRPERSVNDLNGYFENAAAELDDQGRGILAADMVLVSGLGFERTRSLIQESLEYKLKHQDKDLVGLSINASGEFGDAPIDLLIGDASIPDICKQKLMEAKERGITAVRPVLEMTTAVSCDLVTAAGAGGSINQLLEGKGRMAKPTKGKQREGKGKEAGAGAGAAPGSDTADEQGNHPDAQQDKELIQSLLQKAFGDGFTEDDHQQAHEMYQEALAVHEGDEKEAQETAVRAMKMAKHMQAKQEAAAAAGNPPPAKGAQPGAATGQQEGEEGEEGAHQEGEEGEQCEDDAGGYGDGKAIKGKPAAGPAKPSMPAGSQTQESAKGKATLMKEVAALTGEVAKLQQRLAARDLKDHIETKLRESKLPMKATKKFRESILPSVKTIKEFDAQLKVFQEAYQLGGEADSGFILGAERGAFVESASGLDFSDCKNDE